MSQITIHHKPVQITQSPALATCKLSVWQITSLAQSLPSLNIIQGDYCTCYSVLFSPTIKDRKVEILTFLMIKNPIFILIIQICLYKILISFGSGPFINNIRELLIPIKQMEKYRKWTDEATGVNPFIIADQRKFSILYNITTIVFFSLFRSKVLSFSQSFFSSHL